MYYRTKDTKDGLPRWDHNVAFDKESAVQLMELLAVMDYRGAYSGQISTVIAQLVNGAYKRNHVGASFKALAKAGDKKVKPWLDQMRALHILPAEYEGEASGEDGEGADGPK